MNPLLFPAFYFAWLAACRRAMNPPQQRHLRGKGHETLIDMGARGPEETANG
jgi:hypothetical protein